MSSKIKKTPKSTGFKTKTRTKRTRKGKISRTVTRTEGGDEIIIDDQVLDRNLGIQPRIKGPVLKKLPPQNTQEKKQLSYIQSHRTLVASLGAVFAIALIVIALIAGGVIDIGLGSNEGPSETPVVDGDNSNVLTIVMSIVAAILVLAVLVYLIRRFWGTGGPGSAESALAQLRELVANKKENAKEFGNAELERFKELWAAHSTEIREKELADEKEISDFEQIASENIK